MGRRAPYKDRSLTVDWFDKIAKPNFEKHLRDIPVESYLEIGVAEGASMMWVLDNLKPKRAVGVDIWHKNKKLQPVMDEFKANAYKNLDPYMQSGQLELHEMHSIKFMANCTEQFDLIYVDGDHSGPGALTDFLLAYRLLSTKRYKWFVDGHEWEAGGMMVIDDLNRTWNRYPEVKIAQHQLELICHGRLRRAWMEARQCGYVRLR